MRYPALRRAALAACLVPSVYGAASASTAVADNAEKIAELGAFVARTLAANPKVLAASAAVDAEAARNRGAARPLFNPALELEYENADIDLATVEYRQTLDWHDKRGAKKEAADAALEAARATYHAVREQVAGELLAALADLDRASLTQDLAAERVKLLERFVALHERRASAGDIGQTELQLAHIALAEARLQLADAAAETIVAGTNMSRLAGAAPEQSLAFPASIPAASADPDDLEAMATRHPVVYEAHLRAVAARRRIRMSDLDRRSDPTIGVKGGYEDSETLIGLRLDIPLHVRNDFVEQVEAARAEALLSERQAQDVFRDLIARLEGAKRRLDLTLTSLAQWRGVGQPKLADYTTLLEKLWRAGEIGSTEYLVQLRQVLNTRIAGGEVRGKAWLAWLDWLRAAGGVQDWLGIRLTEDGK